MSKTNTMIGKSDKASKESPEERPKGLPDRGRGLSSRGRKQGKVKARPSWDEYFLEIAALISKRSTCLRRGVGALLVKDKRILATGYNGAPRGLRHCSETGCLREELKIPSGERHELCRGLHAEQNVLLQASLHGVSVRDSILYCTIQPCIICTKMLINAGIKGIVVTDGYPDKMSMDFLKEAGVMLRRKPKKI